MRTRVERLVGSLPPSIALAKERAMRQVLLALSMLGTLAVASTPAGAQTNGPYYALPSWAQQHYQDSFVRSL